MQTIAQEDLQRIAERIRGGVRKILVPILWDGHWMLLVVDVAEQRMYARNSLWSRKYDLPLGRVVSIFSLTISLHIHCRIHMWRLK